MDKPPSFDDVLEFTPIVANIARRKTVPGLDASDLIQCVLLRLFRTLHTFDPARSPLRWFVIMTTHAEIQNQYTNANAIKRRLHTQDGVTPDNIVTLSEYPIDTVIADETRNYLLDGLSAVEAAATTAYYIDGNSMDVVCEKLSLSPKQVDNALTRARDKFRAKGYGNEDRDKRKKYKHSNLRLAYKTVNKEFSR